MSPKNYIIFIFILINSDFSLVPNWDFEKSTVGLFSGTQTQKDYLMYEHNDNQVYLIKRITKDSDGSISTQNLLKVGTGDYQEVPFENIDSSYKGKLGLTYVICPMGKFHPYDPINKVDIIPTEFEQGGNGNWYLHCFTHKFGFFYVAYFNNGQRNFYGLQDGKTEWGRQYTRSAWFADKLNEDYNFGNDDYPYIYIGADGKWLKLAGAKLVAKDNEFKRNDIDTINLFDFEIKDNTEAYFSNVDDKFFYMTYDSTAFYSGYSLTTTIADYSKVKDNGNPVVNPIINLISPLNFADNMKILKMNFVPRTKYIYYTIENTDSGKKYNGMIDITMNKVIFNTDQTITSILHDQSNNLLIITPNSAFNLCLFKDSSNNCVNSCENSDIILNTNGNTCGVTTPTQTCNFKLVDEDICVDSCDSIYIIDGIYCKLCKDIDSSKPYRFIGTNKCIANKPTNSEFANEKYDILKCSAGYKLDEDNDICITNCYELCDTCEDFSDNPNDQKCKGCKSSEYILNTSKNCILKPNPTTIIEQPTTILEQPTTIIEKATTERIEEQPSTEKITEHLDTEKITEQPQETPRTTGLEIQTQAPTMIAQDETCTLEKCKTCSEESLKLNLCLSCNEELGYMKVNYSIIYTNFYDCKKKEELLSRFYYNELTNEYRPCYKTCKQCSIEGNSTFHNCLECENGFMFRPGENPGNNCVVYAEFYYLSAYNQYKSMDTLECPLEAKYLVKNKNYCIYDCKKDKTNKYLYDGNCVESCPENTQNEDFVCKENPAQVNLGKNILFLEEEENCLRTVQNLAKLYVSEFKYTENHVSEYENSKFGVLLYKNESALNQLSLEIPKVNFQNCSEKVKQNYGIEGNLLNSIIEKKDKKTHETFYSFFHPVSGEKLEVNDLCKNESIIIKENITSLLNSSNNLNFKLQMSLAEQGINIFDLNDPFYKDICYDFDNPGKRDIALRDRVREAYPNAILCPEGCRNQGINLGDMTASCDCTFHDITNNKVVKENAVLDSLVGEVFNIIDDSNILVVKCYKYIIKYFMRSYGGIITSIVIIVNILLTIIFFLFQLKAITKYIFTLTKDYIKYLNIFCFNKSKIIKAPPKKEMPKIKKITSEESKKKLTNQKNAKTVKSINNKKDLIDIQPTEKRVLNNEIKTIEYNDSTETLDEGKKLKKFFKEYLATSPDEMEFDDAIKKDKRSFCKYFYDNLKEKQIIANTFIASEPIKRRMIKIILFNLDLILYIIINGLFFSEVYISELYQIKEEDEKFFSFLPRSIDRLLYATIVSVIIGYLVDCFFIEEKKIIGIFKREKTDKNMIKQKIIELIKEIKRRYIAFIIIVYILLAASLYYLLCFNYVYPKSQMEWIKSSIAIIIIIQLLSILKILCGGIFRYLSFCCNNEYIFKFSRIFS